MMLLFPPRPSIPSRLLCTDCAPSLPSFPCYLPVRVSHEGQGQQVLGTKGVSRHGAAGSLVGLEGGKEKEGGGRPGIEWWVEK
jgi:hypothetical protein